LQKNSKDYQPFIKWVGGKSRVLKQLLPFFPKEFNNYYEPFLGGGAVFFELFSRGLLKNKKVYLSDINFELINTYYVVRDYPYELIKNLEIFSREHNKEFYYKIRELDRKEDYHRLNSIERATRFIYLNKTCYNGLYRVNKKGYFNTPIGRYKNPDIVNRDKILNASSALQSKNITIMNSSFEKILDTVVKDDLVYFDPPYYPINNSSNFTSYNSNLFLDNEQHKLHRVFKSLLDRGAKVFQTNSNTEFIRELYSDYTISTIYTNRSINSKGNKRGKISEILVRSKI